MFDLSPKTGIFKAIMRLILLIAVAGGLGAISRYALSCAAVRVLGSDFPYGTLLVNILGCLLIGLLMHIGLTTDIIPRSLGLVLSIGFLGSFTTFSMFSYETVRYIQDGAWLGVAGNIGANVILGILATIAGLTLGQVIFGGSS